MIKSYALLIPCVLQGIVMAVDEFHFHHKRKLPRWERVGHPIDTAAFLLAIIWILITPLTSASGIVFATLAVFSCLLITKDELVHRTHCSAGEHFLHSYLFVLHPLMLISAALVWPSLHGDARTRFGSISYSGLERPFVIGYAALTLAFCMYQITYWNFIWKRPAEEK